MNEKPNSVYRLPDEVAELVNINAAKFDLKPSEFISFCIKFCHKIDFVPEPSYVNNPKTVSKLRTIHQLKKSEIELKKVITELRNTQISFMKVQEKELIKPMKSTIEDIPKLIELFYFKTLNAFIETLADDEKTKQLMRKKFLK